MILARGAGPFDDRSSSLPKRGMVALLPLDLRLAARVHAAVERDLRQDLPGAECGGLVEGELTAFRLAVRIAERVPDAGLDQPQLRSMAAVYE